MVYPRPERLPMWPLPDAYDYMCTACGKGYVAGDLFPSLGDGTDTSGRPVPDIDAWDWDPEKQYDGTIREAVEAFVAGAPADAEVAEIAEGVDRYVTGADASLAREVLVADDEADATADPADEYV